MPSRRRLLALASTAAIAGCLDDAGESRSPAETGDDAPNATNETNDSSNGPPRLGSPKSGSCPPHEGRVVCYDEVDFAATPMVLSPDARSIEPGETISFTLENGTDASFEANFYDWTLEKHVDGEWYRVAPWAVPEPLMRLGSGDSHGWQLAVDNGGVGVGKAVPKAEGSSDVTVAGLGGGTYGFSIDGWFEHGDESVSFAATFELDADRLELTPTNDVVETERDGETQIVRADRSDANDGSDRKKSTATIDGDPEATYLLERVDDADRRLIVEQLYREPVLRDALASLRSGDAATVRLEEYGRRSFATLWDIDDPFSFCGDCYELRRVDR